jgi:hypothetical protein
MSARRAIPIVLTLLFGTLSSACHTPEAPRVSTGLMIVPSSIDLQPSEPRRLYAIEMYSDGSTADVTEQAIWASAAPDLATVGNVSMATKGVLTGVQDGLLSVSARVGKLTAHAPVRVGAARPVGLLRRGTHGLFFEDGHGHAPLLAGSHTWDNFQDQGCSAPPCGNPPPPFDFEAYLSFLAANGHNFFRLWTWEQPRWTLETQDNDYWITPHPFVRTGPGKAADGGPQFDLTRFEESYFTRMRERVAAAGTRGIYVSVMLFDGWSVAKEKGASHENNPWRSHPFNRANNVNGINGDPAGNDDGLATHELRDPAILRLQKAYVAKVIDTVGDLDNVLYEISNESHPGSAEWQFEMIRFIKDYESRRPKQHPVGMTVTYPQGDNAALMRSPADWISPRGKLEDVQAGDGSKVIVLDTDHLCGICGDRDWAWKAFTLGHNLLFMDGYHGIAYGAGGKDFQFARPEWVDLRRNLGYAVLVSRMVDLASMKPDAALASSGYVMANAATGQYLAYAPKGGKLRIDAARVPATVSMRVYWLDPATGEVRTAAPVVGGAPVELDCPFENQGVLLLTPRRGAEARTAH